MIFVFAGRPGSGKTTIVKMLLENNPTWSYVQAVTTRGRRDSDLSGQYEHLTEEEFDARSKKGEFILPVSVHGYRSAIKKDSVEHIVGSGTNGIIVLVPSFVKEFMELVSSSVPVYILSVSDEVLKERLIQRGDGDSEVQKKIEESNQWDVEARASGIPYIFIENSTTPQELVSELERQYSSC